MNESQFYHSALEGALLNGKAVRERIDARTAVPTVSEKRQLRISPRLVIVLAAAATLMIASVTYAAVLMRNQIFKEKTNAVIDEHIETVTQPLNPETHEGWQPRNIILFDDVLNTKEDVTCPVAGGTVQLAQLDYGGNGMFAELMLVSDKAAGCDVRNLTVQINGKEPLRTEWINPFCYNEEAGWFYGNAFFRTGGNPFSPGTTFTFTGTVNGEPFTLTYTFTEQAYRTLQQGVIDAANEHKALVAQIPDAGTEVNYHRDNQTLAEVAVRGNLMYFTKISDGTMSTNFPPYSDYDSGAWPVIDGRVGEYFSLGVVDGPYEEGVVYGTVLPYSEKNRPAESLISFGGIVFRYEWETGKVTVPKDEAEYTEWRKESMELSKPYHEEDWIWHVEAVGGTFTVTDLVFHNRSLSGEIGVVLSNQQSFEKGKKETAEDAPVITLNGLRLVHLGEVDPHESITAGLSKDRTKKGYFLIGASVADLPETFTLSVTYQGETVEVTLKRSDAVRVKNAQEESYYNEVFGY